NLNVGRLRIASKGLRREGDAIVEVDEATQRAEGMVMIGDVATLRDSATTMESLHREVSEGSTTVLQETAAASGEGRPRPSGDIAIVGMAAIMPGAPDLETFWSNIVNGVNSV